MSPNQVVVDLTQPSDESGSNSSLHQEEYPTFLGIRLAPQIHAPRSDTTTARFDLNPSYSSFGTIHHASSRGPISPPRRKRPAVANTSQHSPHSSEPARPPQSAASSGQKAATADADSDNAQDMARLSGVGAPNLGHRQVTPPLEHHSPKASQPSKAPSPKYHTPRKPEWDVPRIARALTAFRQDIKDGHARMTSYIIESTKATERRILTGGDLFAGLSSKPVSAEKGETMRIKFKEHTKFKNNKREDHYGVVRIQTDEERVPRYRFHHVEIKKNVLTPNTMLTFVPHLRDLESSEESKYNVWLQELEDIDRKSGFKPMSREEKVKVTVRSEFASTVSLYLEKWLDKLALPGCDKSTLIRYMASREPDDAITPRQKSDILNSHRPAESATPPGANKAAEMFTEAFHRVFHQGQSPTKQIELRDVLLRDESIDSIMDSKPTAKDGSSSQNENEYEAAEYNLGTYCILGCLICFSHSCEHGEYDAQNCKRTVSILPRLSDTLKRRRRIQADKANHVNGHTPSPCNRNCYQTSTHAIMDSEQRPWTQDEHIVLRSTITTADHSRVKTDPLCFVAHLLDRDCCEVFHEYERLSIALPAPEPRGLPKGLALGQSQLEGVGYGLFTAEFIAQDDFIIEYVGELITHDEGVRREARRGDVFDEDSNISYVFTLLENEGIWVDAAIYGNLSRYINHASESDKRGCNITPRILYVNGEYRIKFTAMRDIEAGEELFFNYGENFPNLTKKLLDHKVGGKSDQGKKRTRRPNRADHGQGVARKAPKADKKKPGKGKKPLRDTEDEDLIMDDSLGFIAKPIRKRKRGGQEDSEEEEYHPTGTDATGSRGESPSTAESDFAATAKAASRLRKRARQHTKSTASEQAGKPRGEPKTRGKRGGARPGSGRPRKYPRTAPKPGPAPIPEQPEVPTPDQSRVETPEVTQPVVTALGLQGPQPMEIDDSLEDMDLSVEVAEHSMHRSYLDDELEDDDYDDEDQDVVIRKRMDRGTRNRRPPAKFRDDGAWASGSQ
ncbi:hypothetical protein ACJ41O_002135 [Fusarium nematophilum]